MRHLIRLEEHFFALHEMSLQGNQGRTMAQGDDLVELWAPLKGNEEEFGRVDLNLNLLKNVDKYRRRAVAHVTATLETLRMVDLEMEELRTVVAPHSVGDCTYNLISIQAGIERLRQWEVEFKEQWSLVEALGSSEYV